jgi:hypothetical protein
MVKEIILVFDLMYCGAFATEQCKYVSASSRVTDFIFVYRQVTNGDKLKVYTFQLILGSLLKVVK